MVAYIASALSLALLVFLLLPTARLSTAYRLLLLLGLLIGGLVPIGTGLSLAHYLRGLTDELSIVSLCWLLITVGCRLGWLPRWPATHAWQVWSMFALLGVVLYPAAMGAGMVDSYGWGYAPRWLIGLTGALTLGLLLLRNVLGVALLSLATLAFLLEIKASDNYWDYLLDPFVVLYCLGALMCQSVAGVLRLRRRLSTPVPQLGE